MDEREQQRKVRHRLGVLRHAEEVTGNVAATCRYYGISRQCFYKWQRRYEQHGEEGLRDRSSQPHHSPNGTHSDVVAKILYLRQHYLARFHDVTIRSSGVYRILKRVDMNRLSASQRYKSHKKRWRRYEKPQPGHRIQLDVKFIEPLTRHDPTSKRRRKLYQYTAIDDCTRLRVLRIYERNDQKTAIQFLDYMLEKLPFRVDVIHTVNGSEFKGPFHCHVLDRGINHVYI